MIIIMNKIKINLEKIQINNKTNKQFKITKY